MVQVVPVVCKSPKSVVISFLLHGSLILWGRLCSVENCGSVQPQFAFCALPDLQSQWAVVLGGWGEGFPSGGVALWTPSGENILETCCCNT